MAEQLVNGVIDGTYSDVRSILIYHKGALLLEEYFYGFNQSRPHEMRSLTKSVISLLVGAAADRELLRPDEPALARLGYAVHENPDPRKAKVTMIDLLSNQSGFACDDRDGDSPGNEVKIYEASDWAKSLLLWVDVRHRKHAAPEQNRDLLRVQTVVLRLAAMDRLHVKRVAQHERESFAHAEVREPVPLADGTSA